MIDFDAILAKSKEVDRRREAYYRMQAIATDISPKITGLPGGGGPKDKVGDASASLADLETAWKRAEDELKALRDELSVYLPRLTKWQHRDVIVKRYMEGKTVETIMGEICYEHTQTNRYLSEARRIINQN